MIFFTINLNLKKEKMLSLGGGGREVEKRGARVSEFLLQRIQI